jgi:hypothetical protein
MINKKNQISPKDKEGWEITSNRFVAYIDIMGFKDMVARIPHNRIYQMMKKINEKKKLNVNVKWGKNPDKLIRTTTYSDSIIIYSKDKSYDSLDSVMCTVSGLTSDLFMESIPHKGAIAFGVMTLDEDNSIFFGQPLIDAYLLQEELYFYGVILHSTVEHIIGTSIYDHYLESNDLFFENYLCPFKIGSSNHLAVTPMDIFSKDEYPFLIKSIQNMRFNTSGHLRKYIDNTEEFIKYIKSKE